MPTLGAHFTDNDADAVMRAASQSEQKKVGPWLAEAARQRLEREGLTPGSPRAEILSAVEELGVDEARQILARALRRRNAA